MSENVVALGDFSIPSSEPVAEVIEILEAALEKARDGRIVGVALVTAERDPAAFETRYHGEQNSRHNLAAGVMSMHYLMSRAMSEED